MKRTIRFIYGSIASSDCSCILITPTSGTTEEEREEETHDPVGGDREEAKADEEGDVGELVAYPPSSNSAERESLMNRVRTFTSIGRICNSPDRRALAVGCTLAVL